jgi:hypothetical protein
MIASGVQFLTGFSVGCLEINSLRRAAGFALRSQFAEMHNIVLPASPFRRPVTHGFAYNFAAAAGISTAFDRIAQKLSLLRCYCNADL